MLLVVLLLQDEMLLETDLQIPVLCPAADTPELRHVQEVTGGNAVLIVPTLLPLQLPPSCPCWSV